MNIDAEKIMEDKKSKKEKNKKEKNKKALSFLGSIFTFLFLDFLGQLLVIPLAILIVIYFYLK